MRHAIYKVHAGRVSDLYLEYIDADLNRDRKDLSETNAMSLSNRIISKDTQTLADETF